ncbi:hypothetical protein OpiT1DRAFT_01153 [Opitutaceae bacterium TAV1]|nr:hypothetical protein OpiT1DRAFT_01153 [Opitutaceae bacterium TAV1]
MLAVHGSPTGSLPIQQIPARHRPAQSVRLPSLVSNNYQSVDLIIMSQHSSLRFVPVLAAALVLPVAVPLAPAASAPSDNTAPASGVSASPAAGSSGSGESVAVPTEETILLDKVEIEDIPADQSILPTRPSTSLYGFEETIRETPRSVFQVTKAHLDNDTIQSFSDLARYSPSIQRGSVSPWSVPRIRGGSADTLRNNIVLFNTAVRPFNDNAWESADIVAGVPSVIQGNTVRTAGYVNYVTKKPFFGEDQTELTVTFGRLGLHSDTTYPQYSVRLDHSTELIKDKLAIRFSLLQAEANQYWGNSEADSKDIFAAATWKPNSRVTVETNFSHTKSEGAIAKGINRVTQDLIDNWHYVSGTYVPTISQPNGGTNSADNPGTITGWKIDPATQKTVKIGGDQTFYSDDAETDAKEYIGQVITTVKLNDTFSLRNNTIFQYSDTLEQQYDLSYSKHFNRLFESRFELLSDKEFELFGKDIRHQSNSGFSYRRLLNVCDGTAPVGQEYPANVVDATVGGSYGVGNALGTPWTNFVGQGLSPATGYRKSVVNTAWGWLAWTPTWRTKGYYGSPAVNGNSYGSVADGNRPTTDQAPYGYDLGGTERRSNDITTYNVFSEHKFDIGEKWTWRAGARLSYVDNDIEANALTRHLVSQGYLTDRHGNPLNTDDNHTAWNGDINTSLTFKPARWVNVYFAYDFNKSQQDCGCCQSQGFTGAYNTLSPEWFKVESELFETGAKFEIIPNQLFASIAWFHQTRAVPRNNIDNFTLSSDEVLYQGLELSVAYQPTINLALGANYSYIDASYDGGTNDGLRYEGSPLNSANVWAAYRFNNGFGLKASAWITSSWDVNTAGLSVPTQHAIDLGVFYVARKWRLDIDVLNVTNEKNWSAAGGYGGNGYNWLLPAERLGIQGRLTYRF